MRMMISFSNLVGLLLLATSATAYVSPVPRYNPPRNAAATSPLFRTSLPMATIAVSEPDAFHNLADKVADKIQAVLTKTDDILLTRAMRFVNHAPAIVTLVDMVNRLGAGGGGLAATRWGLDVAPSALTGAMNLPGALGSVPTWFGYCLPILVVSQVAAVARSALAKDSDELSQQDISAMAVSNVCLTRALTQSSPLNWAIAAVASGYYARNGHGREDANLKNLSIQVGSSVATAATVMSVTAQLPNVVPILRGQPEVTAVLGLLALLGLTSQDGNSTVKCVVNAAILGGVLVSKIAGGALSVSNLLSKSIVVTLGTAYVAAVAISRAQKALAGDN